MDSHFWRGVFQNYLGTALATLTVAVVAAIISWRPQLMNFGSPATSFLVIFGTYLMVVTLYVLLRSRRRGDLTTKQALPDQSKLAPPAKQPKQRLAIRITDGLVDRQSNDPSNVVILLNVCVDGPPAKVNGWRLDLHHGGETKPAYQQVIRNKVDYWCAATVNEAPPTTANEALPISAHDPHQGWILFTAPAASKEFSDHVSGATFVLTAVEEDFTESTLLEVPGKWLHRAKIEY